MARRLCTPVLECNFLEIVGRFLKLHFSWTNKLPLCHWKVLMKMMRCGEYAFEAISDHQVIINVHHAKRLIPFKTMKIPSCIDCTPLKYYGGIGFGCNVFLRCHTDSDFTMSITSVHVKGKDQYKVDNVPVVYFCFPTLGVAVPVQPGGFLIFNSLIPHCVSSRYKQSDDMYVVAVYLKSSVVELNKNQLLLDVKQTILSKRYQSTASQTSQTT
jgi:hypothetical protein